MRDDDQLSLLDKPRDIGYPEQTLSPYTHRPIGFIEQKSRAGVAAVLLTAGREISHVLVKGLSPDIVHLVVTAEPGRLFREIRILIEHRLDSDQLRGPLGALRTTTEHRGEIAANPEETV